MHMKKTDKSLLIIGVVCIVFGLYSVIREYTGKNEVELPIDEDNEIITNYDMLVNTCWNNEIIAEETAIDTERMQMCFTDEGKFTYKYIKSKEDVEEFSAYNEYSINGDKLILTHKINEIIKDDIIIYNLNKDYLVLQYDNKLVTFKYYCKL